MHKPIQDVLMYCYGMFSSVVATACNTYSKPSMQVNPQTGKHMLRICTPLCRPMCLFSDAHLTSR